MIDNQVNNLAVLWKSMSFISDNILESLQNEKANGIGGEAFIYWLIKTYQIYNFFSTIQGFSLNFY